MISTDPQFPNISGYTITEQLYKGSRTAVYRAVQHHQHIPVVIKILQREYPTFGELVQFRNQYAIAKNLPLTGIIHPLSLKPFSNGYALVMEDWGGISLDKYIQQQPLGIGETVAIAIQLSDILHHLHQHRIIHKDIKPANILIHPDSKQVKLIDFSIASLLPKETTLIQNPNTLEGTLAYIAPEQTGRMNRGIDYRTDFYSLGVTLYELLTGKLPFEATDAMELVHCHIAKVPTFPHTPQHSQGEKTSPGSDHNTLQNIVMKLMAKNAEDRYQSALGLRYDLQHCLTQWKETGVIAEFELGQRDICDRFNLPEKLYGRESEVQALLDAFERVAAGNTEMMLVAGFSGIGKTAVVNEVHKPITRQRGYFIKGKFDQFNRNIPLSAFVQAFRSLMGQILSESDQQLQQWKTQILQVVGESGQVLIEVIPELEHIIGFQPPVPELSGSAAQNRFNLLLQKFIAVFTTVDHPLVMFLDDLQWADSASLKLLNLLMAESETGYLLVLGAYRDNEVFQAHPLMLTLENIKENQAQIHTLTLKSLAETHIQQLVADTLLCTTELAAPLAELVYQKTQGNPFFTTQFLQGLYEEDCITFEATAGYWQCNLTQIRQLALTDDVVEFMVMRLRKLPEATQEVLKLAAAIGNQFDLQTLSVVCDRPEEEVAADLWRSLQDGLVIPASETYKLFQGSNFNTENIENISVSYQFLHDRIQQAAYSLILEADQQRTHLKIGRLLWQNFSKEERQNHLFTIVNHYNKAKETITPAERETQLLELNIAAADKAKSSAAYDAAWQYYQIALDLLQSNSWQQNYSLSLSLHEANAETAYLIGKFTEMEHFIDAVLIHAKNLLDCVKVNEIKIKAHMAQCQFLEALNTGINLLKSLGIEVPESSEQIDLQSEITTISQAMEGKMIADLAHLPQMEDENELAKVNLLVNLLAPCFQAKPDLFPWIVCKSMQLSIQYGNTSKSSLIYACYGMVSILALQDFVAARQYAKLAFQLDLNSQTGDGLTGTYVAGANLTHYSNHVKETLPLLASAYQAGLENGNFQFGGYALMNRSEYMYFIGANLDTIKSEMAATSHALITLKQGNILGRSQTFELVVSNLLGESDVPYVRSHTLTRRELVGTANGENQSLPLQIEKNDRTGLHNLYLNQLILCYLFEQIPQAMENATLAKSYLDGVVCFLHEYICNFYDSLTLLAHYGNAQTSIKQNILETIQKNQSAMQRWAIHAPMNAQHKYDLVEAEKNRVLGDKTEAIEHYDRAIAGAKENGYIQEEALANELAAKFYLDWGKEKVAAGYMIDAYYCYSRWGAKAKIDDLQQRYPHLLQPILQAAEGSAGNWNTLMSLSPFTASIHFSTGKSSSSTSINQTLDLAAILNASQVLSSTIELDQLLHQLTQIILQNSGADRCVLILPNQTGEWQVRAIATLDNTQLCTEPLAHHPHLPVKLIQYVKNTQEIVVIDDLKTDLPVIDDYLRQRQPKSVLCLPLLNQGQLIGILDLKSHFTIGAFTRERVEVLNFLCTQAAISLENARLYQQSQDYAQQLKQSHLQVVQSEKMASLGSLVAGVAHEINNPLGFLNGSISNGTDYVQDLLEYLETYHQHQPPKDAVKALAEEIDLDFLLEDLPKLLDSMGGATERIKNISTSLRTFSRADTEHKVSANLHEGLDSTLLILKYRLKASDCRPAIEVFKDYGDLPLIDCFPGQLNQVFMNLLANAIDMFDEMAQTQSFQELEANPQQITIRTQIKSNQVYIHIGDNGKGMTQEIQANIFEHLFTTKAVGKGTGLGLAIARQIVLEKHSGAITCTSQLGTGTTFHITLPL